MSHAEYVDWQRYYNAEPFGTPRADILHAHSMSLLANIHRDSKTRPQPFGLADFLLFQQPAETLPPEDEPRVDGLTAAEWRTLFAAEALAAAQAARSRSV